MQAIQDKKTSYIGILAADTDFVLQHVQEKSLITSREYRSLKSLPNNTDQTATSILDRLMGKGDGTCQEFMKLLREDFMQDTFPLLRELSSALSPAPHHVARDDRPNESTEYRMSSVPRGVCVIFNNMIVSGSKYREGSQHDANALRDVFEWLGFTVEIHKDQTADQMRKCLLQLSQRGDHSDAFICCILSHGNNDGVLGTDGKLVSMDEDILEPFNGARCPGLASRPKVFFVQACRGTQIQRQVRVQADSHQGDESDLETDDDGFQMMSIPAHSDFLVAMATMKYFYAYRDTTEGSWFIQSLCKQLRQSCPSGEDILTVLVRVNDEVSRKGQMAKQTPCPQFTLRKRLVFRVPS